MIFILWAQSIQSWALISLSVQNVLFSFFYPQFIFVGKKLQRDEWKKIFSYLLNFDISGSFSATEVPNFCFSCLIFFSLVQTLFLGGKLQTKLSSNSSVQYMFYSYFTSLPYLFVQFSSFLFYCHLNMCSIFISYLLDFHFLFVGLLYFWFRLIFVGGKLQTK